MSRRLDSQSRVSGKEAIVSAVGGLPESGKAIPEPEVMPNRATILAIDANVPVRPVDIYLSSLLAHVREPRISGVLSHSGSEGENLDNQADRGDERKKAWFAINEVLSTFETYAADNPVTSYVQERLDFIADGEDVPTAIVVHDERPNGFAIPGYIVVTDAALALMEYQDELDAGLLGHEHMHIRRDHSSKRSDDDSVFGTIGRRRVHEAEADIMPLEALDEKGINILGQSLFLQRMEERNQQEQQKAQSKRKGITSEFKIGDIEHGSLLDRKLNLLELLWLMDVRNVSTEFTPLAINPNELNTYQKDADILATYDQLDPLAKSHFIRRQIKLATSSSSQERISALNMHRILGMQKDLFKEIYPDRSDREIDELVAVSMFAGVLSIDFFTSEPILPTDVEPHDVLGDVDVVTLNDVGRLYQLAGDPLFEQLGIKVTKPGVSALMAEALKKYLSTRSTLDMAEYQRLYDSVSPEIQESSAFVFPLLYYAKQHGMLNVDAGSEIVDFLAQSDVTSSSIDFYIINLYVEPKSDERDDTQSNHKHGLLAELLDPKVLPIETKEFLSFIDLKRIKTASRLDSIELFQYLSRWTEKKGGYFDFDWMNWNKYGARTLDDGPAEKIIKNFVVNTPIQKMVGLLKSYATQQEITEKDTKWRELIGAIYGTEYAQKDRERINPQIGSISEKVNIGSLHDRMLLWAIGKGKTEYLEQAEHDIELFTKGLKNLDSINELMAVIRSSPERARNIGFPVDWDITVEDLGSLSKFRNLYLEASLKHKDEVNGHSALVEMLEKFWSGPISESKFRNREAYKKADKAWQRSVDSLLIKSELSDKELIDLFALTAVAENVQVTLQVPQAIMEEYVRRVSFTEAMDTIFNRFGHLPNHLFSQAIEYLIEYKARTPEEFKQLEAGLRTHIDAFLNKDKYIGEVSLADGLLVENYTNVKEQIQIRRVQKNRIRGMEPGRLLNALLTTGIDDTALKEYLFERWWLRNRISHDLHEEVRDKFDVEQLAVWRSPSKSAQRLALWVNEVPDIRQYTTMSQLMTDTYLANDVMKYYMLRKILTSENGVLTTQEGRKELVDSFIGGWVDQSASEDGTNVLREMMASLITVAGKEELYQRLNPILLDLILRVPEHQLSYKELAPLFADDLLNLMSMTPNPAIREPNERDRELLSTKLYQLMTGGGENSKTKSAQTTVTKLLGRFSERIKPKDEKRLSPLDLGIMVGKKSGAVGVRLLQLSGQYFPVGEGDKEKFLDIYDNTKGQTRIQAWRTLVREAKTSSQIAELVDNIDEIQERIGGGSLVTYYKVLMNNGDVRAIAVKNPNVEYHVGQIINTAKKALADVIVKAPNNKDYQLAEVLLSDVGEWIHSELTDPSFEEKDALFRIQHDKESGGFDPGSNRYKILVPKTAQTGTRYVRNEQFIEGKNLTRLRVTDEPTNIPEGIINQEDYRHAVSLMVRDYLYQLTETGLVHSDIHPGNFRITEDNTHIAIFDRYNLLELDATEKNFIQNLVPAISLGGVDAALQHTIEFLFAHEKNVSLAGEKDEIVQHVLASGNGNLEQSLLNAVVTLKQQGVHVPLKISLIARNLFALNLMAKGAGFEGIVDAYGETATEEEVRKLLSLGMKNNTFI